MSEIVLLNYNEEESFKLKAELEDICSKVSVCSPEQSDDAYMQLSEDSVTFFCKITNHDMDIAEKAINLASSGKNPLVFVVPEVDASLLELMSESDLIYYIKEPYTFSELTYVVNKASDKRQCTMENLQLLCESVHDIAFTMASNGDVLYVSPSVEWITGFTQEETLKKGLRELVSEESFNFIGGLMGTFAEKLKNGGCSVPAVIEIEAICKDGSTRWLELTVTPVFYEGGNFRYFSGVMHDISDRKEAEERFKVAIECSSDLIYEWDMVTDRLEWFGDIENALGYEHGDIHGSLQKWYKVVHPDDLPRVIEMIETYRIAGDVFEVEYRVFTKDGRIRYWKEHGAPIFDDVTKEFVRTIGVCSDITERIEAEHSLEEKDEMFRLIAENANDVIWTLGVNGEVLYVSPSLEKLRGFTPDELKDVKIEERFTPESAKLVLDKLESFYRDLKKGNIYATSQMMEVEQPCKDGSTIWVEFHINPVLDKEGNFKFFLGISRDISERRKHAKTLDDIFDLAPIPMLLLNRNAVVEKINRECMQVSKVSKEMSIGKLAGEVFSCRYAFCGDGCGFNDECKSCVFRTIGEEALDAQKSIHKREGITNIQLPDGSVIQRNMLVSAAYIDVYDDAKVIMSFEDITERKKAEEAIIKSKLEAEQANRTKSEFLATMSHELRTPLNAILGYSQMLLDDSFGSLDPKQQKFANHVHMSGKHLLALINDILDLSKVEAGKMDLHFEEFSVNQMMKDVFNIVVPLAEKKNIDVNIMISEDITIYADKVRFKQILYNLLSNAVKFTENKGNVTVTASSDGASLSVSVVDDGIGISDDELDRLFMPFYQADSSTARIYPGTGLGLSIVKTMVELHNGTIEVRSTPGEGSTFTFTMPLKSTNVIDG